MSIHNNYFKLNLSKFIGIILIAITLCLFGIFFKITNPQISSLISGLATGFALATVQFFFSWYEYAKIDKYERLKIRDIRPDRDNRELYESLIINSKKEIIVLGSTATRLINDFADSNSSQPRNKVLLSALSKGVVVKILLPDQIFLHTNQQAQFSIIKTKFEAIAGQYPNFQFKYFQHEPYHSIFLADDDCILGPIFPGVSSKNTPSIHVDSSSPFAKTYLDYFNNEWQ
ncbi:hypothetical protein J3L18_23740 [Mucilaginibacter gossypii]|uniref:hypothetical protein n=1 Tax=Mucilaginibacter gossypii TaxID=551996 RepID=UPI000DCDAA18|nr:MULTISPECIES: hypothetical protein [Mucilaginibacter]QTE36118.1 hypothetical protein J3L18_23740 [Mucilaginibacter gossypii]RAV59967.1 hypothetical protein DIU36_03065 [Mucilaginibacter rubeus]